MCLKKQIIVLCCGLVTTMLPIAAKAFTLPPYDTEYPGYGTLFSLWKENHGKVFQKAYDKIYQAISTGKGTYKYNNDDDKTRWRLGCFNAYFGTSLWRSRPKLTAKLEHWLPASGQDQGESFGNWKQFSLDERAPGDLGMRIPEILSVQRERELPGFAGMRCREMEVASDMDYLLEQLSWNTLIEGRKDKEEIIQYTGECLCVLMSEEFLRKIFTDPMVDLLLQQQQRIVDDKIKGAKSDGRRLMLRYDVIPGVLPYKNAPKRLGFSVKMHLYDIHRSTDPDDLQYSGKRGCICIPALDESKYAKSRKNLSITLKFIFDAESKQLIAVGLKDQVVINASLVLGIGEKTSELLFVKQP